MGDSINKFFHVFFVLFCFVFHGFYEIQILRIFLTSCLVLRKHSRNDNYENNMRLSLLDAEFASHDLVALRND